MRVIRRNFEHVIGAHAGCQQGLMGITHGGVGHQDAFLILHPARETLWPQLIKLLLGARANFAKINRFWHHRIMQIGRNNPAFDFGVAIDRNLADEAQQACGTIPTAHELEQIRRFVNETGRVFTGSEFRVIDQVFKEGQVSRNTANTEFAKGPVHAIHRFTRGAAPCGDLFKHTVIERCDHRPGIGRAAIKTNAKAVCTTIHLDDPVIGDKVVFRVFGGDTALKRMITQLDLVLPGDTGFGREADAPTLRDQDLCLDQIKAGHAFGDGVFDLNTGIDLDEIKLGCVNIHKELDRPGIDVVGRLAKADRCITDFLALIIIKIGCGRTFNDFLVATLNGTVTLIEMNKGAVGITKKLNLDMAGTADQFFKVNFTIAKGGLGLAAGGQYLR